MESEERRELYETLARDCEVLQEILRGDESFTDSLDHITTAMEGGLEEGVDAFTGWYSVVSELVEEPLTDQEAYAIVLYYKQRQDSEKRKDQRETLQVYGGSAVVGLFGAYIRKKYPAQRVIGNIMIGVGATGVCGMTAINMGAKWATGKLTDFIDDYMDTLYEVAAELDDEIAQSFSEAVEDDEYMKFKVEGIQDEEQPEDIQEHVIVDKLPYQINDDEIGDLMTEDTEEE